MAQEKIHHLAELAPIQAQKYGSDAALKVRSEDGKWSKISWVTLSDYVQRNYRSLYAAAYKEELANLSADKLYPMDLLLFPTDLRLGPNYLQGLEEFLQTVTTTRYFVPIHWNGTPDNLKKLETISEKFGFKIVDTSQGAISAILK